MLLWRGPSDVENHTAITSTIRFRIVRHSEASRSPRYLLDATSVHASSNQILSRTQGTPTAQIEVFCPCADIVGETFYPHGGQWVGGQRSDRGSGRRRAGCGDSIVAGDKPINRLRRHILLGSEARVRPGKSVPYRVCREGR